MLSSSEHWCIINNEILITKYDMVAEKKGKWLLNFTSLVHQNKHNLSNRSRTLTLSRHDKILTIWRL